MLARLVTAYVPLRSHPRTASEYGALGERLSGVPVRKKAFYQRVEDTWMYKHVTGLPVPTAVSVADNPTKNSFSYHCVQHEKIEWLREAAREYPDTDVLVWVDYGIFHQPDVCNEAIVRFMGSVDDRHIYAPGCWEPPANVSSDAPCWRFCGSVLAVPTWVVDELAQAIKTQAIAHITATRNVEWEVNTWARAEQGVASHLPWKWYKADHNVSQFTNLPLELKDA
jgi:hypothetical protein